MTKALTTLLMAGGISTALFLSGCTDTPAARPVTESDVHEHGDHDHGHEHHHVAPHDGHLIELGDHKFNLEVTFNAETKEIVLYVLGPHAQTPVAIQADQLTFEVVDGENSVAQTLVPVEEGDASSVFKIEANDLLKSKATMEDLLAKATLTMGDTSLSGDLTHDHGTFHEHEGHDHDHEGHDHADHDHKDE